MAVLASASSPVCRVNGAVKFAAAGAHPAQNSSLAQNRPPVTRVDALEAGREESGGLKPAAGGAPRQRHFRGGQDDPSV